MAGYNWGVGVTTSYSWFEDFAEHRAGFDFAFDCDTFDAQPNQYSLMSPHFEVYSEIGDVADCAAALVSIIEGALYLQRSDFHGFDFNCLFSFGKPQGRRDIRDANVLADPFPALLRPTKKEISSICSRPTDRLVRMASKDNITRGMLAFLGVNGPNWITLYALLDFMKSGGWDEDKIIKAADTSKAELKRFTQTANNPGAIGPFARHGQKGWKPPATVMTLDEARAIILPAACKYLDHRGRENFDQILV